MYFFVMLWPDPWRLDVERILVHCLLVCERQQDSRAISMRIHASGQSTWYEDRQVPLNHVWLSGEGLKRLLSGTPFTRSRPKVLIIIAYSAVATEPIPNLWNVED